MQEIKAFIHRNRAADVIHALKAAGVLSEDSNLSVTDVKGTLDALDNLERDYSAEMGGTVITEVKLELVLPDDRIAEAVAVIRDNARTGQKQAGWVFVSGILEKHPIGD